MSVAGTRVLTVLLFARASNLLTLISFEPQAGSENASKADPQGDDLLSAGTTEGDLHKRMVSSKKVKVRNAIRI